MVDYKRQTSTLVGLLRAVLEPVGEEGELMGVEMFKLFSLDAELENKWFVFRDPNFSEFLKQIFKFCGVRSSIFGTQKNLSTNQLFYKMSRIGKFSESLVFFLNFV